MLGKTCGYGGKNTYEAIKNFNQSDFYSWVRYMCNPEKNIEKIKEATLNIVKTLEEALKECEE